MMSDLKTKPTGEDIQKFINSIEQEQKRNDCQALLNLMKKISGEQPEIWGGSMVGFGRYSYEGKSGRKGEWFTAGFAPRKQNISIYIMAGFDRYPELMANLGKFKTGVGCLYVKTLDDIDMDILATLVTESIAYMRLQDKSKK